MKNLQEKHRKFDVLCAGAAVWDTLYTGIDSDLLSEDSILAQEYHASVGGDAANTAVNLARLGMRVSLCALLGRDIPAEMIREDLRHAGVYTGHIIQREEVRTGSPAVLIDTLGDRHIIRVPGSSNHYLTQDMITDEMLEEARHLHVGSANVLDALDGKPLGILMKRAHEHGLTTSMDVSYDKTGRWMENIQDALENCDIFIPSMQEAVHYCNSTDPEEICAFFAQCPLKVFGLKMAEQGVLVTDGTCTYRMPTLYKGIPKDTTGAGDAFMAGFLCAWLEGYDLPSCAALGSAQSASVLRETGACRSAGTWEEAQDLLEVSGITLQKTAQ